MKGGQRYNMIYLEGVYMGKSEYIYAYASIRTSHTKEELRKRFGSTKIFRDFDNMFLFIPENERDIDYIIDNNLEFYEDDVLQVDVMTSRRDNMHVKLDGIIRMVQKGKVVIVVTDINSFGNCADIKKYYKIFREQGIGVLIPDYTRECHLSEYSTFNYGFVARPLEQYNRAFDLVESLNPSDMQDKRGRMAGEYTDSFRVAFWLYELFKVSEKTAVAMSGYSRKGFHLKADSYEQTALYKRELEAMNEKFAISKLVKRNRPVPEKFDRVLSHYEKEERKRRKREKYISEDDNYTSLELTCMHCKIPMIFPVDFERLKLKYDGGKRELARCLARYDNDLIAQFDEWVGLGNDPTKFYHTFDNTVMKGIVKALEIDVDRIDI